MKKCPIFLGLLQALGAGFYVALIARVLYGLEHINFVPPVYISMTAILLLLVISAAITGSLIFAYPAILVVRKKTKEAVKILISTFAWLVLFLCIILGVALI